MTSTVYLVIGYTKWISLKESGALTPDDDYHYDRTDTWLIPHIAKRSSIANFGFPQYAFLDRPPPHHLIHFSMPKLAVLKVRVPECCVVRFDDDVYVCDFVNEIENGHTISSAHSDEDIERLFVQDVSDVQDVSECRKSYIRAFVPLSLITRSSVRKVWIYRKGKRLTRKR